MMYKHLLFFALFMAFSLSLSAQFPCLGGTEIETDLGTDTIDLCQDIPTATIQFGTSISALPFGYVVVDENDVIVYIDTENEIDFSAFTSSNLRVYAFNFVGSISASVGDTFTGATLANGCFTLTDNFISVTGDGINGGTVSTEDGATEAFTCPGDGMADLLQFDSAGVSDGVEFTYVVTDDQNNILALPGGDVADFEDAGAGTCRVWGLAYVGNITAMIGDNAATTPLADICFDLSDNFVTVYREQPEGGMVMTENGETEIDVCVGSEIDMVQFDSTGTSNSPYTYVLTDTNNVIVAVPAGDIVDFSDIMSGDYRLWGLAYTGNITAMVGDTASAVPLTDDCFDLSDNFVIINRDESNGGTVMTADGSTELFVCVGDGVADSIAFDSMGVTGPNFTYVVTDEFNIILGLPGSDIIDFEGAGTGTCRVWGLAYSGNVLAMVGDTASLIALSDGCFDLSDNFVTIERGQPEGGIVSTEDGLTEVYTCPGDGMADIIQFDSANVVGAAFTYVITDDANVILGLPGTDMADFEDAGGGTCRVWGLAYTGNITAMVGDTASAVPLTDECFDLSDNFITVYREAPDGGTISTEGGATEVYTCPGDSIPDIVRFDSAGVSNSLFAYVITDDANVILGLPGMDMADFEDAGTGTCRVWGLAYTGNITAMLGDTASAVALTDDCFDLSDNFITVYRETPEGGTVSTEMGEDTVNVCVGDGVDDIIRFDSTGVSNSLFTYVITDDANVILGLPGMDMANFEDAGTGTCRVWGLAYTGNITAMVGDTASAVPLTDECFDLSDNFITVFRDSVEGGSVTTEDGMTEVYTCPGDGVADIIRFDSAGVSGPSFTYVITDDANVILGLPGMDMADLDDAGAGTCRIWGLAYSGNITATLGDTASAVALTDACFDLSDNFITVYRETPEGGTVSTEDGATEVYTCPGDSIPDIIHFDSMGVSNSLFTYVITDDANVILGVPGMDMADFEDAGTGTCRVWGLAYTGNITAMLGDTASAVALTDDCFDLSDNFITVYREVPEGGTVSTEMGEDTVSVCVGDGIDDIIEFDSAGVSNSLFTYVITDEANVILSVPAMDMANFDDAGGGTCRVWGLAYTGNITAMVGDTASAVPLTDDCFDLSDNFITVLREEVNGGMVATNQGETEVYTCPGDTLSDIVIANTMGSAGQNFTFVLTDDQNIILDVPDENAIDLTNADPGTCRIWGLAYSGDLIAELGDDAGAVALSDGCFSLSGNFITVYREAPNGGMVMTEAGETEIEVTVGDTIPDVIAFDSTGVSNSQFTYVVTDGNNVILSLPAGDEVDFENADPGECRVWGLAYTGNIIAEAGDNAADVALSSDCFSLSSNFVTVTRTQGFNGPGTPAITLRSWPNPAGDVLQVAIQSLAAPPSGRTAGATLEVVDLNGQIHQQRILEDSDQNVEINISNLVNGMYFLRYRSEKALATQRFTKQ